MRKIFFSKATLRQYVHAFTKANVDKHHGVGYAYHKVWLLPIYILDNMQVDYLND